MLHGCCWQQWLILLNMSLDTESSVGEEREEQGRGLHGGHTAKGAESVLHFYTSGQRPFPFSTVT